MATISKSKKKKNAKKKAKLKKKKQQRKKAELSKKEQRAIKKQRDRQLKELKQHISKFFGIGLFLGIFAGLASGDPKLIVLPVAGILATGLSYKYPRKALWFFIIYLPFSGTITYAIGNSPVLQLAKDGFYVPALVRLVQECKENKQPIFINKAIKTPLLLTFAYCCLVVLVVNGGQQFDPSYRGHPILMGVLGLKVFLGYAPLIFCVYYLIKDKATLVLLMRITAVVIIICCALGFIQYVFLLTGICPPTQGSGDVLFKASLDAKCFVGGALLYTPSQGVIRLPGTFVAPWQWGWFLISASFLAFATAFNDPKIPWRLVGFLAMAANFVMAVVSGQRIALALVPVTTIMLLVMTGQLANLKRFLPIATLLPLVLGVAIAQNPDVVGERLESFESRWRASPPQEFITHQIEWALNEQDGVLGNGLGRATNSARVFGKTHLVETYYPKVMFEVGILGAVLFLGLVTVITLQCFKSYRSSRDPILRGYGAAFWVFVMVISYNTYYYPLDVDPVAVYYWFFAGAILKIPELDRLEKARLKQLALEEEALLQPKPTQRQRR
ncbi:MAG: hormogonium polysaccharide biosynthesis protein HpsL [Cyanobacteria bacterium P01_F01_bin.150]